MEVASSSLVGRSIGVVFITPYMVTWPSGKARVCKTLIHQFKSGRHLQKIPGSFGFRDFLFLSSLILEKHSSAHFCGIAGSFARWQQRLHGGHPCAVQMHPVMVSAALPRGGALALRRAAIQQQRLAGAEHHGGGLSAAERRPPSPLSTPTVTAGRSSKRPLLRISTTTTTVESN